MRASSLGTGLRATGATSAPIESSAVKEPETVDQGTTTTRSSDDAAVRQQNEGAGQAPGGPSARGDELPPSAVASFVRNEIATALRSRNAYSVNTLLGGMDLRTRKPSLYWLDYLAACVSVPYAAHGYAQYVAAR